MRVRGTVMTVIGLGLLALPQTALAGTASVEGGTVVFRAAPGEINRVSASINTNVSPTAYTISDGPAITAGPGCTIDFYDDAVCDVAGGAPVLLDTGDGADELSLSVPGRALGGPGDDVLKGSAAPGQTLDGGPGNDLLNGDNPPYCIEGSTPSGPDVLIGGDGVDTADYSDSDVGQVTVTLDGAANDGGAGEGDNVNPDIENVDGTTCAVNDITGGPGPNALTGPGLLKGMGGDDTLTGSGQADDLQGGDGNDKLMGLFGNDKLDGGAGDDFLEGGFDDDMLTGGPGLDSFVGDESRTNTIGTGNDRIFARDGVRESVSCGPGSDVAELDADDDIPVDTQNLCEVADRAAAPPGGGGGGGGGATKRPVAASGLKLVSKRRSVSVKLTCAVSDAAGCNGTVRVTGKPKGKKATTLGSVTISLAPSKARTFTLKLGKSGRALVKRYAKLPVTVTTSLRTSAGKVTVTQALTLRR